MFILEYLVHHHYSYPNWKIQVNIKKCNLFRNNLNLQDDLEGNRQA